MSSIADKFTIAQPEYKEKVISILGDIVTQFPKYSIPVTLIIGGETKVGWIISEQSYLQKVTDILEKIDKPEGVDKSEDQEFRKHINVIFSDYRLPTTQFYQKPVYPEKIIFVLIENQPHLLSIDSIDSIGIGIFSDMRILLSQMKKH